MKTYTPKADEIERTWYVVDAGAKPLGRIATEIAHVLRGKHKPSFTPHLDVGDHVIVINADKIVLTGRKMDQKNYYRHSGYIGGLKTINAKKLMEKKPEDIVRFAVKGMLPKNPLGRKIFKKLKVYKGDHHPHEAQQPEVITL